VVDKFVEKAAENGVSVFRIFDACNDPRNLKRAADAAKKTGKHVQMAISSMAMGTSHSPTETVVETFRGTEWDTGFDIMALLEIAAYFRDVRKKYAKFESSFLGADTRILASQVPGGMLSNLENQLKEQNASAKIDEVLKEIQIVQKDCGYIPLVTPTSQIVGTQAVFNVLFGRYKNLTQETADLVTGRYGALAAPANPELVTLALEKNKYDAVLTERPADTIPNEFDKIEEEAKKAGAKTVEDALTYAMFPKVAPGFFQKRGEGPVDSASFAVKPAAPAASGGTAKGQAARYSIQVNGAHYDVVVAPAGTVTAVPAGGTPTAAPGGVPIPAPVAGTVLRYAADEGADVKTGQTVIIMESMKMELEVKAAADGKIHFVVPPGTQVAAQQIIAELGGVPGAAPAVPEPVPGAAAAGAGTVPAPVAGTILRYAAAEGVQVKTGDTIIIMESMKMELEIKATADGGVHFLVPPGTQVASQQPIAEIS
jgi:oxaloacetate decarboxylase alpha subunit